MDNTVNPFNQSNPNTTAIATLLQLVQAVNNLNQTMQTVFPNALTTAASATGGAATLPASPVGFVQILNPSDGSTILVPYYSP